MCSSYWLHAGSNLLVSATSIGCNGAHLVGHISVLLGFHDLHQSTAHALEMFKLNTQLVKRRAERISVL